MKEINSVRTKVQDLPEPITGFPPEVWATTRPSARAARIKQRLLANERQIDVERARFATESYRATEGEPMVIRRAKLLLHLVRSMSLAIQPDEVIVGNRSLLPRMGIIAPEGAVDWVDKELEILPTRPQDRFNITAEQIRELREEIFPYWRGRTLEDIVAARVPEDVRVAVRGKAFSLNQTDHAQGHILPAVETWLRLGLGGLRQKVLTARQRPEVQSPAQQQFYDAALIGLQAAAELMQRYADLAGHLAAETPDPARQAELQEIAAVCAWLAEHPARDFREALQAVWFLFVLLQIESNASSFSPGRFDQYMLPYLARDLTSGKLSLAQAQALLEDLWLKFNEIVLLRSSSSARYFAGFPIGFNLIIGG
ncbi:MAG TPA: pyruvate formate lyase family protein, partial [Anaerolineae bacterium]|nr:pyruvate formate lyase family protein [Anaerolineae bacterium]